MAMPNRRSILQTEILVRLQERPAESVAALARAVDSSRPSVSRSLHALAGQGYVRRDGRAWKLTEAGIAEAEAATAKLRAATEDVVELAGRRFKAVGRIGLDDALVSTVGSAFGLDLATEMMAHWNPAFPVPGSALESLGRSAFEDAARRAVGEVPTLDALDLASASPAFEPLARSVHGTQVADIAGSALGSAAIAGVGNSLAADLTAAVSPLVGAQADYARFLSLIPSVEPPIGYDLIARQTDLLAGALDNVLALQQAERALLVSRPDQLAGFSWIPERLTAVTASLSGLFEDQVDLLHRSVLRGSVSSAAERLVLAAAPVTDYTGAVRYMVEAEDETAPPTRPSRQRALGDDSLDERLEELDPDFVEMRHGSWHALSARGPDYQRHAGVSQRELMDHVLRHFVPADELPEDHRRGPQTRARMRKVLGGSKTDAEFVDAMAQAMYRAYEQLSTYTHGNEKHEQSLRYLLRAGEGLIGFILVNATAEDA